MSHFSCNVCSKLCISRCPLLYFSPAFGQASATASGIFSFGAGNSAQPNPGAGVFTFGAKPADGASKPDVTTFSQIGTKRSMEDDAVSTKRGRASSGKAMHDASRVRFCVCVLFGSNTGPSYSTRTTMAIYRSFAVIGPSLWNRHPPSARPSLLSSKLSASLSLLKTCLCS